MSCVRIIYFLPTPFLAGLYGGRQVIKFWVAGFMFVNSHTPRELYDEVRKELQVL